MNDITIGIKLLGALATIVGIWKLLYNIKMGKSSQLRAEYDFSKKFFEDSTTEKLHPFTLEKGYQALAGSTYVKSKEVEYILTLEDPVQCLHDYVYSRHLMEKLKTEGDLRLSFKPKYKNDKKRKFLKKLYSSLYFILAFSALSPLFIKDYINASLSGTFVLLMITIPSFGLYAWLSLNAYFRIKRGEHLISNQEKHTKRVIVKQSETLELA